MSPVSTVVRDPKTGLFTRWMPGGNGLEVWRVENGQAEQITCVLWAEWDPNDDGWLGRAVRERGLEA